jgi:hypothetical protein
MKMLSETITIFKQEDEQELDKHERRFKERDLEFNREETYLLCIDFPGYPKVLDAYGGAQTDTVVVLSKTELVELKGLINKVLRGDEKLGMARNEYLKACGYKIIEG